MAESERTDPGLDGGSATAVAPERPDTKVVGVAGLFDDPDALVRAAARVRDAGWTRWDCHTPYPVHGLERAMGLKTSPVPYICLGAGFVGGGLAMLMQWWMSAVDFPIVIGGKPLFSWPAFVPITFELFVLLAAVSTFGAMILLCRLGRWHSPLRDTGFLGEVMSTRFAVVLSATDPIFEEADAHDVLSRAGCQEILPLVETLEEDDSFL